MTPPATPEDQRLAAAFETLEPTSAQIENMAAVVMNAWTEPPRSLINEWFDLLRVQPMLHISYSIAAVALLMFFSPLGALLTLIVRPNT